MMKKVINMALAVAVIAMVAISCQQKNRESVKTAELTEAKTELASKTKTPKNEPGQAKFDFEVEEYNFGTVNEGDIVEYVYKFKNTGEEPLLITNAYASCGCTVPSHTKTPVAPGEAGEINVKFNTRGKKNNQSKTITIVANTNPVNTKLVLKGMVTPKADSNPS